MSSQPRSLLVLLSVIGLAVVASNETVQAALPDSPARKTALKMMRGVNFGNYLEYQVGAPAADATYSASDFRLARAEWFDHIGIPVAWSLYCGPGPDFPSSSTIFSKADEMVTNALANGLAVVLD